MTAASSRMRFERLDIPHINTVADARDHATDAAIAEIREAVTDAGWFDVTQYGAKGNGVFDDGMAIGNAAAALQDYGGGVLYFPPGDYAIYTTSGGFIINLANLSGFQIIGHGARFMISTTNAALMSTPGYGAIIQLSNCHYGVIDGFEVTGPDMSAVFSETLVGAHFCQFVSGCTNIRIPAAKVQGVGSALIIANTLAQTLTVPQKNISVGVLDVRESFYGVNGRYGLHSLYIDLLKTTDTYRSAQLYADIRDLRINVWSTNAYGHDFNLSCRDGYGVDGARVTYRRDRSSTGTTSDGTFCVHVGFGDATPATFRDVAIDMNIDYFPAVSGGSTGSGAFRFVKNAADLSTPDTADRGHVVDGLRISGAIKGTPYITTGPMIFTQTEARWGPTLDQMRGIVFRDLTIETALTAAIDWDCGAMNGETVLLDNVHAGTSVVRMRDFATSSPAGQTSALAKIVSVASEYSNQFSVDATPATSYPIEHRLATPTNLTIPTAWMTDIPIHNLGISTNPCTHTLPVAAAGLAALFVNNSTSAIDWRLDPGNGTDIFRGAGGGKYLQLASGAIAHIRCFVAGTWEVLSLSGTITYEP